jgi:hypothetical protein
MKHIRLRTSPMTILLSCILTLGVFILDLYAPAPLATGMLYVAPVALIAMWVSAESLFSRRVDCHCVYRVNRGSAHVFLPRHHRVVGGH